MATHRSRGRKNIRPRRRTDLVVFMVIMLALIIRIIYLLQAREHLFYNDLADSLYYHRWAEHIITGQQWSPIFFMGPLYPYLVAFFYILFGLHSEVVLWFQVLLGSISCGLVYLLGRMAFDRSVGLLAALMAALYIVEIFYEGLLLMATTLWALNLLMLVSIFWVLRRKSWYLWIIPGLLLGLSALGRASVLFFLPFLMWGIFLQARNPGRSVLRGSLAAVAVLLGLVLVIAPVTVHNAVVGHDVVLLTSNFGLNFFVGNNPDSHGYYEAPKGLALSSDYTGEKIAQIFAGKELSPSGVSRFWLERSLDFLKTQPRAFLKLTLDKLLLFWNAYEIPQAENIYFFERFAPILKLPWLSFTILGPLGLLGMILSLKSWRKMYFLLAFVFSLMSVTVLFFVLSRLRLQVCSALMVFAASALMWLWKQFKQKNNRQLAIAILSLIPLAALVNRSPPAINSDRDLATSHTTLAVNLSKRHNDLQGAIRECELAVQVYPQMGGAYLTMADLLIEQGRIEEVVALWKKTLEVDPEHSYVHFYLGNMFADQGLWDQAIVEYRAEIEVSPYYWRVYGALSKAIEERRKQGDDASPQAF